MFAVVEKGVNQMSEEKIHTPKKIKRANSEDVMAMFELVMEKLSNIERALDIETVEKFKQEHKKAPKVVRYGTYVLNIMKDEKVHSTFTLSEKVNSEFSLTTDYSNIGSVLSRYASGNRGKFIENSDILKGYKLVAVAANHWQLRKEEEASNV